MEQSGSSSSCVGKDGKTVGSGYTEFTVKKGSTCEAKDLEGTEQQLTGWNAQASAVHIKFARWILLPISSLTDGNSGR